MAQPPYSCSAYKEADMLLAIQAFDSGQIKSMRRAASTFNVPRSTLQTRCTGITPRRDCQPKSKKLTKLEEEVIVGYILDLDLRGFAPSLDAVRDIADKLLSKLTSASSDVILASIGITYAVFRIAKSRLRHFGKFC